MICLVRIELLCTPIPPNPIPGVVDILNVVQFVFPPDYITPVPIRGFVPLGYSLDLFWEIVSLPSNKVGIFSLLVYWKL